MDGPARRFVFAALRWSGIPAVLRSGVQRDRVTILVYHRVDPESLDQHLSVLTRAYDPIPLAGYVEALRSGSLGGLPPRSLVITLDDGHKDDRALLDVFRAHGVRPTIFLCSGIAGTRRGFWWMAPPREAEIDRLKRVPNGDRLAALAAYGYSETRDAGQRVSLSHHEIGEMRECVDFQAHTITHPILSRCDEDQARREIAGCKTTLERVFGLSVYALAYPNGLAEDYGAREIAFAREAGYACAVTAEPGYNGTDTDPFRIKRICIPEGAGVSELLVRASGLAAFLRRLVPARRVERESEAEVLDWTAGRATRTSGGVPS